ncbi:MAG: ParB/RepB/Spo0J family partition protein [candidate division WOR-3 bacterium]
MKEIDVTKIIVPEVRITSSIEPEVLEAFKSSIKAVGVIEPIIVIPSDDKYMLVDGFHRLQEVRNAGLKKIKAVILPGRIEDVYLANIATNTLRGKIKHTEVAAVINYLYNNLKIPMETIAEKTGYKLDDVDFYIRLANVDQEILEALDKGKIKLGHVKELMRLKDKTKRLKLLTQILSFDITVKDTKDIVDQIIELEKQGLQKQEEKDNIIVKPATGICAACNQEYEVKFLRGFILCPNCYSKIVKPYEQDKTSEGGGL